VRLEFGLHMSVKFYPDPLRFAGPDLFTKSRFSANTYYAEMHMHDSVKCFVEVLFAVRTIQKFVSSLSISVTKYNFELPIFLFWTKLFIVGIMHFGCTLRRG